MAKQFEDSNMDIRTLELNIKRGLITKKDHESYVKSLPDLESQAGEILAYEEPAEIVEDEGNLTFSIGR